MKRRQINQPTPTKSTASRPLAKMPTAIRYTQMREDYEPARSDIFLLAFTGLYFHSSASNCKAGCIIIITIHDRRSSRSSYNAWLSAHYVAAPSIPQRKQSSSVLRQLRSVRARGSPQHQKSALSEFPSFYLLYVLDPRYVY